LFFDPSSAIKASICYTVAMKIVDWRTGQSLKVGDIADWGPAPKTMLWCGNTSGVMVGNVGHIDVGSCERVPYPKEDHSPGYQLLAVETKGWKQGRVKIRMLKNDVTVWWPLSIRFMTKHGLRVGYIID